MKKNVKLSKASLVAAAMVGISASAHGCEPILPFIKVVGGPGMLTGSWIILGAAVLLKSAIFAWSQKNMGVGRAFGLMILANMLTTVIGFFVAVLIGSGPILFLGAFIVWPLCLPPARRAIAAVRHPWMQRFSPGGLATLMTMGLCASCFLFGFPALFSDSANLAAYWLWKLSAVYAGLVISIVLTAFWEEWVVWKLTECPVDESGYVQPVIRANLAVLFCVMLLGAGIALPKRLKSPNFLVKLGLVQQVEAGTSLSR